MQIKAHAKIYEVLFEENFQFISSLAQTEQSLWVIDKDVFELYRQIFKKNIPEDKIMLIKATEDNKIIETALEICERMIMLSGKRNSTLISVGGGIIQDVTGFAANILYRGIKWIFVPTTLLASCDSCIGSKTSLNYKKSKNLLGTFYPPDELHICPTFFDTLSSMDFLSGLGEVVKFNIMAGRDELKALHDDMPRILQRDKKTIIKYTHKSLEFKKGFIEADEYDNGIRILLNFAHTFGHAIETVTDYAIPHGTAVAMGTIIANEVSCGRGWISKTLNREIQTILLQIIDIDLLKKYHKLNILRLCEIERILQAISKDKKQISDSLTAILFKSEDLDLTVIHDLECREVEAGVSKLVQLLQNGR